MISCMDLVRFEEADVGTVTVKIYNDDWHHFKEEEYDDLLRLLVRPESIEDPDKAYKQLRELVFRYCRFALPRTYDYINFYYKLIVIGKGSYKYLLRLYEKTLYDENGRYKGRITVIELVIRKLYLCHEEG